ncbi:MAG TPA: malto-oligosyltrehalose synthase [Candidatus Dormibacteraeota bacterium]
MTPRATYRVQLHRGFGFEDAAAIAGYLAELGVSHLYCSPYLQAAEGSTHGYDVVDPTRINEELGGADGHRRLTEALTSAGLGQVLDIVPNHMAIAGRQNRWWWDVLENGPSSPYAGFFDVDWDPPEHNLRNTVRLPILDDHYGHVLEAGRLSVERQGGEFTVRAGEHELPVSPGSLQILLGPAAESCGSDELAFLAESYARLPGPHVTDRQTLRVRHRDKEVLNRRLAQLIDSEPYVAGCIDRTIEAVNADGDRLHQLLERQNYRLAFWRTSGWEVSYRRFFDINSLAALRVEDPHVFDETHALVLRLVREGVVGGLRIDHPDGLRDPEDYFRRLRREAGETWIVAEKILSPGERLPLDWPVDGTTGYDFLNLAGGLFVNPAGGAPLQDAWAQFTGAAEDFAELAHRKKHQVIDDLLASDFNRLTEQLLRICEHNRRYRDYTRPELYRAIREAAACLPVYRTYASPERGTISDADRAALDKAFEEAAARQPDLDPELLDFLHRVLALEERGALEEDLAERFQQTSGPTVAKGVEDTAFYAHLRLVALNEVGGDPERFGVAPEEFHAAGTAAAAEWPAAMVASSTHDTKRSEDVRARLYLLSEMPGEWAAATARWAELNERHRVGGLPDRGAEYLLYQTLVGAHPLPCDRAQQYMLKAVREAKEHTSWSRPDEDYEAALAAFVAGILGDAEFTGDLDRFVAPLVEPGRGNSLAIKLLTLTAPGVPDVYQGSELWDLSLVDPDNRRPVDYSLRRRLLSDIGTLSVADVVRRADEGLPKLLVVQRALQLRRDRPQAFAGGYEALAATGSRAGHVVAFCRGGEVVTAVPRLSLSRGDGWGDTSLLLPPGRWTDVFSGARWEAGVSVGSLLHEFPVALLARGD